MELFIKINLRNSASHWLLRIYHDARSPEFQKSHMKTPYSALRHKHNKPRKHYRLPATSNPAPVSLKSSPYFILHQSDSGSYSYLLVDGHQQAL
jgi:hypothetical protein